MVINNSICRLWFVELWLKNLKEDKRGKTNITYNCIVRYHEDKIDSLWSEE